MEIFDIFVISRKICRNHFMYNSDHFFDIWLIETKFTLDDKFYISFFLFSNITIDHGNFIHHKNFHYRGRSSFGDDDIRDIYQVIHKIDESEYFYGIFWMCFCYFFYFMTKVLIFPTDKNNLSICFGSNKFLQNFFSFGHSIACTHNKDYFFIQAQS